MPHILDPQNRGQKEESEDGDLHGASYEYDYPRNFDLKPGSDFHEKLLDRIMTRAHDSHRLMQRRYSDWRETDRVLRTYVPPEQSEDAGDGEKTNTNPSIVIPQSYATMETILTYLSSAFLQNPIWKYEGQGPEDVLGAELMTHVVHQQATRGSVGLNLHTQWADSLKYGIGVVSPVWEREFGKKTVVREQGFLDYARNMFNVTGRRRDVEEDQLIYEGNKLLNIDPYSYLPDPNISAHEIQDAEFAGWVEKTNRMSFLGRDKDDGDYVFNGKYLKHIDGRSSILDLDNNRKADYSERINSNNPLHVIWEYIDIIPDDWGVGNSQYPETWLFGVAGDKVVVAAQPLGLDHGMKPLAVCAPDYDGYSANPISRLGMISDIQNLMDFLYSSHIQNVRKSINDMFVVDPKLVNYHDVANPEPGKLIRMRRSAWGKGVLDQAVKQLNVQDVTQGHVADASYLSDIMQQVSSANDFVKGSMPNRSSRVSATEVNQLAGSSMNRLEKTARIISMQSMMPVGRMFASHVQQLMQEESYLKTVGNLEEKMREDFGLEAEQGRIAVNPLDMVVDYDVMPHDGSIPGAEDAQTWIQLYQTAAQNPQVAQGIDFQRVFKHIARQMGAKNVDDFLKKGGQNVQPQVMPDDQVQNEAQKGNLTPMQNQQPS